MFETQIDSKIDRDQQDTFTTINNDRPLYSKLTLNLDQNNNLGEDTDRSKPIRWLNIDRSGDVELSTQVSPRSIEGKKIKIRKS